LSESHGINTLSCLGGHTGELTLAKYPESGAAQLARHQVLLMEQQLLKTRFLIGDAVSLADVALLAYTRVAHEGGFDLEGHPALRRWIGEAEQALGIGS